MAENKGPQRQDVSRRNQPARQQREETRGRQSENVRNRGEEGSRRSPGASRRERAREGQ
jgi:hypothetical protein